MEKLKKGVTIYPSAGERRWRIVAGNYEIIGASTESYKNWQDCFDNLALVGTEIVKYMES